MIIAFGKGGQVGTELGRLGAQVLGRAEADLSQTGRARQAILDRRPSLVINAAAWTDVDGAETSEPEAAAINAEAPGEMAKACAEIGVPFVHVSTDYVFDGSGDRPWHPEDQVAPLGAYGRTKADGEERVRQAGGTAAVVRTSWVISEHGSNFAKTMLRLGTERDHLDVVADQIGGPTPARALAAALVAIGGQLREDPGHAGTYHVSGRDDVSWADFARAIMGEAGLVCSINDVPTSEYPTTAPRPLNSRLDCAATREVFGLDRPDWRSGLREIIRAVS